MSRINEWSHYMYTGFVPSQWETALLYNDVSHWLGASLESVLCTCRQTFTIDFDVAPSISMGTWPYVFLFFFYRKTKCVGHNTDILRAEISTIFHFLFLGMPRSATMPGMNNYIRKDPDFFFISSSWYTCVVSSQSRADITISRICLEKSETIFNHYSDLGFRKSADWKNANDFAHNLAPTLY